MCAGAGAQSSACRQRHGRVCGRVRHARVFSKEAGAISQYKQKSKVFIAALCIVYAANAHSRRNANNDIAAFVSKASICELNYKSSCVCTGAARFVSALSTRIQGPQVQGQQHINKQADATLSFFVARIATNVSIIENLFKKILNNPTQHPDDVHGKIDVPFPGVFVASS